MKNLTKAIALMMEHSKEACSEITKLLEITLLPPETFDSNL
jgi:hypothetical protein